MIAKRFRFHGYGSLKFVYSKGRSARSKYISLKYIENTRRTESRLAVVVSKKVSKKAPERNRIRRRIYELCREQWANIKHPHDIVVTVFDERVANMPTQDLKVILNDIIRQADLYL